MTRQRRYPLFLDTEFPPEKGLLEAVNALPEGERACALRVLILLGHGEIERQRPGRTTQGEVLHGTGTD